MYEVIWHGFKFGDLATLAHVQLTLPLKKSERERENFFPISLRGRVIRAQVRQHKTRLPESPSSLKHRLCSHY